MVQWWRIRDFWRGQAGPGPAGHGGAGQGEGTNGAGGVSAICGMARRGAARPGVAGRGWARAPMVHFNLQCPMRKADKMTERKQFEEDPEIAARVELLKLGTSDYSRGHVLLWEVAEGLLGLDRNDEKMKYAVLKWRKYVHRELRIETWAIPGTGVKLLTESEQIEMLPQKRARRAYRQHGLILRAIRNTNLANLTDHQRRIAAAVNEHSRAARTATNKVTNTTRGKIPNDRQALIDRARRIAEEIKIR